MFEKQSMGSAIQHSPTQPAWKRSCMNQRRSGGLNRWLISINTMPAGLLC